MKSSAASTPQTARSFGRRNTTPRQVSGPASQHSGPRSSPTVADGKVVTLGVGGVLSCVDAAKGKLLWRKDDFSGAWPKFYTASSPIVTDGLCIAQLGSESNGGIVAYDLATGDQKWKWTGDGTAYASPVLLTVEGTKMVVTLTAEEDCRHRCGRRQAALGSAVPGPGPRL